MLETLARSHVVVLHLPIGLLVFAAIFALFFKKEGRAALDFAVGLAALTSLAAAATGWLLQRGGGYDEAILSRHEWLGFSTAAAASAAFLLKNSRFYRSAIWLATILAAAAGHLGGSLTHGADWLFPKKEAAAAPVFSEKIDSTATAFDALVQPIFQRKCVSCHGPTKQKRGLRLDSAAFLKAGSERGPVILSEKPAVSRLLEVLSLPVGDEKRMPPTGKPPLSEAELSILKRWILAGASFEARAVDFLPEKKAAAVEFAAVAVGEASATTLEKIKMERLAAVEKMGNGSNWLAVSLAGKTDFSTQNRSILKKIGPQTAHFDARLSPLDDASLIDFLSAMPNLTRLDLAQTQISDASATAISSLRFLKILNLSGCKITDGCLEKMTDGLPELRQIFLWRTATTELGMAHFHQKRPSVSVETGVLEAENALPELVLKAPKIEFSHTIFDDTVQVGLFFGMPDIDLFYTLDEASPTTRSLKFDGKPLIFDKTTRLRAIAAKTGWRPSPTVEMNFVKRKWKPESVRLVRPPTRASAGNGAAALSDGLTGESYNDAPFLGFQGEHLEAIFDFGRPILFTRLSVHFAEDNGPWVFAPAGLQVWSSSDERTWRPSISKKYTPPKAMRPPAVSVISETASEPTETRFLKIRVENLLKNPSWHPSKGLKSWIFVDEIMVE